MEEISEVAPEEISTKKKPTPASPAVTTNGTPGGKKRKASETKEEVQTESPAPTKKGKKANVTTPSPKEVTTPTSSGKKSVRFSQNNHVKEFDKLAVVATTPVTPSSTKPKSVLTTPPSKTKVAKKK